LHISFNNFRDAENAGNHYNKPNTISSSDVSVLWSTPKFFRQKLDRTIKSMKR